MDKSRKFLIIAAMVFSLFSAQSQGDIFPVTNSDQLRAALITAQTNGKDDEIRLFYGTYTASGPFVYGGVGTDSNSITLSGGWDPSNAGFQSNDAEATILDGNNLNPVLQIDSNAPGVNITFVIKNLTIENGYARSADYSGAGILTFTGPAGKGSIHLDVNNCIFQNNSAANNKSGGAIYSTGSLEVYNSKFLSNSGSSGGAMVISYDLDEGASASPIVENCYFEDNYNYGNQGSTIYTNCAAKISGCTFKGRSDGISSSGNGSCIWGSGGSHLTITNSIFSDITIKYWGSAIQVWDGNLDIINCLFANNHSGVNGDGYGAIAFLNNSSSYTINITNCTFSGNTASASYASAIDNRGGNMNLNNCIFWENAGETGVYNEYGRTTMKYCVYDNSSMGYGVTDGGNNKYVNPIFIGDNVFRLSADSPCIDAGNNDLVPAGITTDVAGKPRFRDDPYTVDTGFGTAPIVDIGAYEFVQTGRFGNVNGKNTKLTLKDTGSNDVTFALTGSKTALGTIDPCDPSFGLIEIYNFNDDAEKAALAISTKAKIGSHVGSINCFGPMKSITAKNIDLTGDMTIGSASTAKAAATIVFDEGKGLNINSDMPIKSITSFEWWGSLTATSIGSISTKSDRKLNKHGILGIDVKTGVIGSVKVADGIYGSWDCQYVKSITAPTVDDFYLTLSQKPDAKIPALGTLTAKNWIDHSQILSAGNIGTVTTGAFVNSSCFAGVASAYLVDLNADEVFDLPLVLGDTFDQTATIKSIAIKGIKGETYCFINSNIAAANISSAYVAYPEYLNAGAPFGISMYNDSKTITIKDANGTHSWKIGHIGDAVDFLNQNGGDMRIRRD
jgi:predicted outer membrane repeat protein